MVGWRGGCAGRGRSLRSLAGRSRCALAWQVAQASPSLGGEEAVGSLRSLTRYVTRRFYHIERAKRASPNSSAKGAQRPTCQVSASERPAKWAPANDPPS